MIVTLVCGAHQPPLMIDRIGEHEWQPGPRRGGAQEWRCPLCGRTWRLGAKRNRALSEAATRGELPAVIDLSALP